MSLLNTDKKYILKGKKMKRKALTIIFIMAAMSASNLEAKNDLHIRAENIKFENVEFLPQSRKELLNGANVYIAKKLMQSSDKVEGYVTFDKPVVVAKDLFAYSTQKYANDKLEKYEDENDLLFTDDVKFKAGSVLNIRTNMDSKLSDFVNFHKVTLENGELLVRIIDNSKVPRFIKLPIFVLPAAAEHAEVKLIQPVNVGGVYYALKREKINDDYLLFYLSPLYESEEMAQKFAAYENSLPHEDYMPKNAPDTAMLREKVTVFKNGRDIYTSNLVDLFTK